DDDALELLVDLLVAALEVDVLEFVEGERLLHDAAEVRALPAAGLRRDEVRLAELDLVLAGEHADLRADLVGAIADFTDLVGDPELQALRGLGREDGDRLLLAAVLERDAHVAAGDGRGLGAGLVRVADHDLL